MYYIFFFIFAELEPYQVIHLDRCPPSFEGIYGLNATVAFCFKISIHIKYSKLEDDASNRTHFLHQYLYPKIDIVEKNILFLHQLLTQLLGFTIVLENPQIYNIFYYICYMKQLENTQNFP
jgi:hypothetical protein